MTNAPLANISDDVLYPTEWLGYLHPNYIKMLNKIPILIRNELNSSVDRYAKSHPITTANTVILYANELIDKYYLSNNIRLSSTVVTSRVNSSSSSDNIIPIPEVTFKDNINPVIIPDTTNLPKPPTVEDQSIIESVSCCVYKQTERAEKMSNKRSTTERLRTTKITI